MRVRKKNNKFSVHAIAGTYVVILGINAKKSATKGLLGFAIHRIDHTENEQYWLKGFKTFKETEPDVAPGTLVSTLEHPVQSFLWGDYTAKSKHRYTYTIMPMYGKPKNMEPGKSVKVEISTENEDQVTHAIYFNRGVAASQAYVRKFRYKKPKEVKNRKAFIWLSRGLEEALLAFIGQANSARYGLRAAVYEFNYLPVLNTFAQSANNGADVKIIYDSRKKSPREANDKAIRETGIRNLVIRRTRPKSYISHNKFIVLLKNGKPIEVWTGSTNITAGGILGQSNVGHIIRDHVIAEKYYTYWQQLSKDPTNRDLRKWNIQNTPDPLGKPKKNTITAIYSPRPGGTSPTVLNWYAERMDSAAQTINLTAAFGVNPLLTEVLAKDKDYLRYLLLEKRGKNYDVLSRDRDVRIAIGAKLSRNYLYRWTKEKLTGFNVWVSYIHTKFMLIDPLTDNPTVITGSANFSEASTTKNDENMLVIQGDKRVADVYLGEFMRLFNHFYFRNVVNRQSAELGSTQKKSVYLKPDDSWCKRYYKKRSLKEKQRLLFG